MNAEIILPKEKASLPAKYMAAKVALQECDSIDECKDWSNKAQALSSYAKQADDRELERTAQRIRARAVRRCGELLKMIKPGQGARDGKRSGGNPTPLNRRNAAEQAGMSKDQQVQAIRVANVPEADFEEQLESESPPTIETLAEQGTKKSEPRHKQLEMTEKEYRSGAAFRWNLAKMAAASREFEPQDIAKGSTHEEVEEIREGIQVVIEFFGRVIERIEA